MKKLTIAAAMAAMAGAAAFADAKAMEDELAEAAASEFSIEEEPPAADEKSSEVVEKMKKTMLANVTFGPPASLQEVVRSLFDMSRDMGENGRINFIFKLPDSDDASSGEDAGGDGIWQRSGARLLVGAADIGDISLYDALKLACRSAQTSFDVKDGVVVIGADMPTWTLAVDREKAQKILGDDSMVDSRSDWSDFFESQGLGHVATFYNKASDTLGVTGPREHAEAVRDVLNRRWKRVLAREAKDVRPNVELQVTVMDAPLEALGACGYFSAGVDPEAVVPVNIFRRLLTRDDVTITAAPRLMSKMGEEAKLNDLSRYHVADPNTGVLDQSAVEGGGIEMEAITEPISLDSKTMSLTLSFRQWGRPQKVEDIGEQVVECPTMACFQAVVAVKSGTTAMFTASSNNKNRMTLVFVTPLMIGANGAYCK